MRKKILITGQRRSGTTFLANFLNAQKKFLVKRDFLGTIFGESKKLKIDSFKDELSNREKNVLLSNLRAEFMSAGENVDDIPKKQDFSNLFILFEKTLDKLNKKNDKIVGVKRTGQGYWIDDLLESTDIHVIYMYRDIRDVLLSSKNRFSDYTTISYLISWNERMKQVIDIKHERLLKVKFEELILNPDNTIEKISDFIGEEITKDINFAKDRTGLKFIDNSSFHDINKLFDKRAVNRWKDYPDSKEVRYSEILIPEFLEKLGYAIKGEYNFNEIINAYKEFYIKKSLMFTGKIIKNVSNKIISE